MIVTATLGDLEDLLVNVLTRVKSSQDSTERDEYEGEEVIRGLDGIRKALGVGKTKAQEIKNSGVLDEALDIVTSRIYYVHVEKARQLYRQQKKIV